ncbi:MFS transporter [Dactylosporangium fulvum]|uniref:MFS transporter n=1 Tax=Dactylosporangium fulvum TaxID=53359 RepID=UPI0031D51211
MSVLQSAGHAVSGPPVPDRRRRRRILMGLALGYFMVLLDMTVLSVAEPDLAESLGTSMAGLQWATTGYTVTFAALLLSAGAATDRYGASRLFRAGTAVFAAASLLTALAPALWVLVVLRAVMGVAAAACVPASMALIARLYPEPAARARAIAAWAATSGAAVAAGPIAGGALVGVAGWRAVFLINIPIALLVLGLALDRAAALSSDAGTGARPGGAVAGTTSVGVRPAVPPADAGGGAPRRIDWPAQVAAAAVLALATATLIAAGARNWPHTVIAAVATVLSLGVFVRLERRSDAPVLHRQLIRVGRVRAVLLAGAAVNFALSGALFVLPLLLQQHLDPLHTGLAFLPLTVPFAVNPPLTGRIVARVGPYRPIVGGLALLAAGGVVMAVVLAADASYPWLALGLLLTGSGVSFALPALTVAMVSAAPAGATGAAGGMLNAVRQTGATVGVAAMGATVASGAGASLLVSSAVCAFAAGTFALVGRAR